MSERDLNPPPIFIEVLDRRAYFASLESKLGDAGQIDESSADRVTILGAGGLIESYEKEESSKEDEKSGPRFNDILLTAIGNKADIALGIDALTIALPGYAATGPDKALLAERKQAYAKLGGESKVKIGVINEPSEYGRTRWAPRCEIGAAVIKDQVYIAYPGIYHPNAPDGIVLSFNNKQTADMLHTILRRIIDSRSTARVFVGRDRSLSVNENIRLLFDAGIPQQSLITDTALQLINDAEKLVVASAASSPHDQIVHGLADAWDRGVTVTMIDNPPPAAKRWTRLLSRQSRLPADAYTGLPHDRPASVTPILVTENRIMLTGYTLSSASVRTGTSGLAIVSPNTSEFGDKIKRRLFKQSGLTY